MREFVFTESNNIGEKFLDESKFLEIATESVERRKQYSIINTSHETATTGRDLSPSYKSVKTLFI